MAVVSSAGDFSVRSIQPHQKGHHLIIIRTNGRTDRQNNEMVITRGGGGQILHGNYTQRGPRHATSKGLCWQTRTCNQHVGLCSLDACRCLHTFHVVIPSLLGGGGYVSCVKQNCRQNFGRQNLRKESNWKTKIKLYRNDLKLTSYSLLVTLLPTGLTSIDLTFYPQFIFCCVWISEKKKIFVISKIKWLVVTSEMESVYCRVWTRSFTITDHFLFLKDY